MTEKTARELEIELFEAKRKLEAADRVMIVLDAWVQIGIINARSEAADARLNYGEPYGYEHVSREFIKKYEERYGVKLTRDQNS